MENKRMCDIAVIGGGAAGMMAAISASDSGAKVVIIEKNKYTGRKIGITGKGRCNVTNNCTVNELLEAVRSNPKFLYGAANKFTPADTMEFFENAGVRLKTERGRRVFPVSNKASDIQFAFDRQLRERGVKVLYNSPVKSIEKIDNGWRVKYSTPNGVSNGAPNSAGELEAKAVVVATGGLSYPLTGSTGDGHKILSGMGVKITPLRPSLVPVETAEDYSSLSGLSLKNVTLTVMYNNKTVCSEMGEMLFTHFGVSGPLVLSASANMQKGEAREYKMMLNLKPALMPDELDKRIVSDFVKYSAKDFVNSLSDLLPQKLIPVVVERTGIDPHKKTANVTREERQRLVNVLREFEIGVKGFRPIEEAIITAGGVDVSELSPKTMEFKNHHGLFAAGEIIDVDAYTGGYNLQLAFSTGHLAGKSAAEFALEW